MGRPPSPLEWQPPDGAQVLIHGLVGDNAVFNGCHGHVLRRCNNSQRLVVCVDESRARLRVYPHNLRRPSRPPSLAAPSLSAPSLSAPSLPPCGLRAGVAAAAASLSRAAGTQCQVHLEPSKRRQLGFGAEAGPDGQSLRLTRIDAEGLLCEWNLKNPSRAVRLGDRIVEVNGKCGGTQALAEALRSPAGLDIVFRRTAGTASSWLPAIAEKAEARPFEPTVTGALERRGSRSRGLPPHHGCDGLPAPGDCALPLDKERGASLLQSLKMMVAQLEVTCNDEEAWGRRSSGGRGSR